MDFHAIVVFWMEAIVSKYNGFHYMHYMYYVDILILQTLRSDGLSEIRYSRWDKIKDDTFFLDLIPKQQIWNCSQF